MMHMVNRVRAAIFHNIGWKLLSLAAAAVIWALVASEPELATFTSVRLEYKNMPEDLEIVSDPVETVVLELRGPSGELRGEGVRPAVILDLAGITAGLRAFTIGNGNVRLAPGVRLVRSIPPAVHLRFAARKQGAEGAARGTRRLN